MNSTFNVASCLKHEVFPECLKSNQIMELDSLVGLFGYM